MADSKPHFSTIVRPFADDDYTFALPYALICELEEKRGGVGPMIILARLESGAWPIEDIAEVIRLGLIGGGMDAIKARKMVKEYVEAKPALENLALAYMILCKAITGAQEPPVEKLELAKGGATASSEPGNGASIEQPKGTA